MQVFGLTLELLGPPDTATIASKLYDSDDAGSGDDQDGGAPATQSKMKEVKRDRYRKADLLVVLNCVKKGFRDAVSDPATTPLCEYPLSTMGTGVLNGDRSAQRCRGGAPPRRSALIRTHPISPRGWHHVNAHICILSPLGPLGGAPLDPQDAFSSRNEERWGLAMTILAFVYTSGNEVNENQLIKFLKDVGISWNKGKHDELKSSGSVLVQELTSQKFLYKKQGEQTGDARIALYRWGPRAKAEVSEGDVLAFLADVYGQPLSVWADMLNRPIAGMDESDDDEL